MTEGEEVPGSSHSRLVGGLHACAHNRAGRLIGFRRSRMRQGGFRDTLFHVEQLAQQRGPGRKS